MSATKNTLEFLTLNITDGKHGDCASEDNSGYYFISCKDVYDDSIHYENARQITQADFEDTHKRTKLEKDDILITNSGTIGRMAFIKEHEMVCRTTFQKSVAIVKPNAELVCPKYLFYLLKSRIGILASKSNGAAQKNLLLSTMRQFEVEYESDIARQKEIVCFIESYDELIENSRKQIALLEEAAQRLYREWFVDFRFPGSTSHNSLPQDWQEVNLAKIGEFKRGKNLIVGDSIPGNVAVIAGGLTPSCYHNVANTNAPVITVSGSGANAGYTAIHLHDVWASDCSYLDRNKTDHIFFIYCFLKSNPALLKNQQKGAAQPHVYAKDINAFKIVLPPTDLLQKFEEMAATIYHEIGVLRDFISTNISARDKLLPKLMSGELKV